MENTAKMAEEIAYGAKEVPNTSVTLRRIADDVPSEVISQNPEWSKIAEDLTNTYPTNKVDDLVNEMPNYDAIIFGSPTRFGNMAAPMKALGSDERFMDERITDRQTGCGIYRSCFGSWRSRNNCYFNDVSYASPWNDHRGCSLRRPRTNSEWKSLWS